MITQISQRYFEGECESAHSYLKKNVEHLGSQWGRIDWQSFWPPMLEETLNIKKTLLVYHLKTQNERWKGSKSTVAVFWKSNKKSSLEESSKVGSRSIFVQQYNDIVKTFWRRTSETEALHLIDNNTPSHLFDLQTCSSVKVVYLPLKKTSLIQPMNQGVAANYKAYNLRRAFRQLIQGNWKILEKSQHYGLDIF